MGRTLNASEVGLVTTEIDRYLRGAVLQDARQPRPLEICLEFRVPGETVTVLLSADPAFSRIHMTERRPANPPVPFAFQSLLRARLCGERIEHVGQLGEDRVAELGFTGGLSIVAELTGRHANIFFCETQTDEGRVIVGSIRPNLSQRRALIPGHAYVAPAPPPSPPPAKPGKGGAADPTCRPAGLSASRLTIQDSGLRTEPAPLSFNLRIDDEFGRLIEAAELADARARAVAAVHKEVKRLERLRQNIARDLAAAEDSNEYGRYGEVLKQNLAAVHRGSSEAVLTEYAADGPRELRVPLKPEMGPRENMERYFRLAKRLSAAKERISKRYSETESRAARLTAAGQDLVRAETVHDVHNVLSRAGLRTPQTARPAARPGQTEAGRLPYREFFIEGAGRFLVGRSAEDNDTLTFRVARGSDLWFHTIGFPGSHVVAPLPREREPSAAMIAAGARLAASRSQAPEGEKVEVAYTRQKYVRKPKGAKPGTVLVSKERRILVTVEKGAFADKVVPD